MSCFATILTVVQEAIKQGKAQKVAISVLDVGGQVHERFVIAAQVSQSSQRSSQLHGHLLQYGMFSD